MVFDVRFAKFQNLNWDVWTTDCRSLSYFTIECKTYPCQATQFLTLSNSYQWIMKTSQISWSSVVVHRLTVIARSRRPTRNFGHHIRRRNLPFKQLPSQEAREEMALFPGPRRRIRRGIKQMNITLWGVKVKITSSDVTDAKLYKSPVSWN